MPIISIKPLRDKILGTKIAIVVFVITLIVMGFVAFMSGSEEPFALIIIWGILIIFLSLVVLAYIQWYYIYEDKIIIKNIYGVVKKVYFSDVIEIIQKRFSIFTKDKGVECYVFIDKCIKHLDRKLFWENIDNKKNRFVRVPITEELKMYIEDKKFKIVQK